jgi:proteasome lid subunit RPN8/RPN11
MQSPIQIPTHYTWEAMGKAVSVQLDYDFVDRLSMEIMRGFSLVPKRGAEVGGVLLGTVEIGDKVHVRVEDYEVVACEYLKGPSFLLSETEEERFASTVKRYESGADRRLYVVGMFRSHTRDSGLALAPEDIALFRNYTNDPANIILLVRPYTTKPSVAGIFFEEDGEFHSGPSYKEFPFRRRELGGSPVVRSADEAASPAAEPAAEEPDLRQWSQQVATASSGPSPLPEENSASARFRRKWILIPVSFVFLLLGVVAGFQSALVLNRADQAKIAYESLGLGLEATRDGEGILLRWDRTAPAVQFGRSASLSIEDGEFRKSVKLDGAQLQNGSVFYRGANAGVLFRLEVETQRRAFVTESVQYQPKR